MRFSTQVASQCQASYNLPAALPQNSKSPASPSEAAVEVVWAAKFSGQSSSASAFMSASASAFES